MGCLKPKRKTDSMAYVARHSAFSNKGVYGFVLGGWSVGRLCWVTSRGARHIQSMWYLWNLGSAQPQGNAEAQELDEIPQEVYTRCCT